jgi:hypothetical protein
MSVLGESIRLVCTDGGQHPSRALGVVLWDTKLDTVVPSPHHVPDRPSTGLLRSRPGAGLDFGRLVFKCPTCGRDLPARVETLKSLFLEADAQGRFDGTGRIVRVDISGR